MIKLVKKDRKAILNAYSNDFVEYVNMRAEKESPKLVRKYMYEAILEDWILLNFKYTNDQYDMIKDFGLRESLRYVQKNYRSPHDNLHPNWFEEFLKNGNEHFFLCALFAQYFSEHLEWVDEKANESFS